MVERQRLLSVLDQAASAKLTAIVAGAGYGKTVLAADFLERRGYGYLWYQLEEADCDLTVFLSHLAAALCAFDDGLSRIEWEMEASQPTGKDHLEFFATLLSEVQRYVSEDLFIVLDDFHEVNGCPEIIEAMEYILRRSPPNLHFMILSCSELSMDLSRLKARRELLEVKEEDLLFSTAETMQLFSAVFEFDMNEDDAEAVTELTEGWVSGIVLIYHFLKGMDVRDIKSIMRELTPVTSEIFDYLQNTVYRNLDSELQDFLLKTSILSRVEPSFCDELVGTGGAEEKLLFLARSHLFITSAKRDGSSYRYHPLLRKFLNDKLESTLSPEELAALHSRASCIWEERGEPEQAIIHSIEAGDFGRAVDLLESIVDMLFKAERISFLRGLLERMPADSMEDHPRLTYNAALVHDFLGQYHSALELYARAADSFRASGDINERVECLKNMLRLNVLSGKSRASREVLDELMEAIGDQAPDSPLRLGVTAMLGAGSVYLGLTEPLVHIVEASLDFAEEIKDDHLQAMMLTWCAYALLLAGDPRRSIEVSMRAESLAERKGYTVFLPDIYCYLSLDCCALGEYGRAWEFAQRGLEAAAAIGEGEQSSPSLLQNRLTAAICLLNMGGERRAREEITAICTLAEETENSWLAINAEFFAGIIFTNTGEDARATAHFKRMESVSRRAGFVQNEVVARLCQLALALEAGDAPAAGEVAAWVDDVMRDRNLYIVLLPALLLAASVNHKLGRAEAARQYLEEAVALTRLNGMLGWWKGFARFLLPLIKDTLSRGDHVKFLSDILRFIGPPSLLILHELKSSGDPGVRNKAREITTDLMRETAEPLEIRLLGAFQVTKGGEPIGEARWKSKKALTVMKYLAAHRAQGPVQRDVLMEILWPERDRTSASRNLNMALTALRKTLEPRSEPRHSSYLVASGNTLRLLLGNGGWTDLEAFRSRIREAEEQKGVDDQKYLSLLGEAEDVYRGDLLAEDVYEDWCRPLREELKADYMALLMSIADTLEERGDYQSAIAYVEKAILGDAGNEELYRRLMRVNSLRGDRAGVERSFERCSRYLAENFDVSPSPETVALYHALRE